MNNIYQEVLEPRKLCMTQASDMKMLDLGKLESYRDLVSKNL